MPKSIVVCCDGTNNQMTGHATNVLRLYRSLLHDDDQITFYDPGVGTLADPMALSRTQKFVQRSLDAAIGRSLCHSFSDAYRFLCLHAQADDEVYLFGFSRGAYTVRALAGAIHMLGLVRPELVHLAPYVWAIYANDGGAYDVQSRFGGAGRFRKMFCVPCAPRIRLMGVWDTVSSFGWFWDFQTLPYTASNPSVELVRHAVAIDEHRAAFPSNLFYENGQPSASEKIKQIWFAGVHSDVGGGYPDETGQLSKIAFDWMIKEVQAAGGLRFDLAEVDRLLGATGEYSRPNALADPHESLTGWWNVMEWLPRRQWHKVGEAGADGAPTTSLPAATASSARPNHPLWVNRWSAPHLYRRRTIPEGAWIHPSVRERQSAINYQPPLPASCVDLVYVPTKGYMPRDPAAQ